MDFSHSTNPMLAKYFRKYVFGKLFRFKNISSSPAFNIIYTIYSNQVSSKIASEYPLQYYQDYDKKTLNARMIPIIRVGKNAQILFPEFPVSFNLYIVIVCAK